MRAMAKTPICAAASLALLIAHAANPPLVKEGLWSIHTQSIDNPGNKKSEGTYSLCRDHSYDQSMARARGCTTVSESVQEGKYSVASHCVVAGTVIESKQTTTFQGDTAYHSERHATYTPAFYGKTESTMIIDQRYVGSCPAGVQPGDRIGADGKVNHLGEH
jgi:hypothetical protein